jgi:predicted nucleic acid-binding protein
MLWLLDTVVVSELRRAASGRCDPNVLAWASTLTSAQTFLSVVSVEELEVGVRRKERLDPVQGAVLRRWLDEDLLPTFEGRVLPIDMRIARAAAAFRVPDPAPEQDARIAATALVHDLRVATRDARDFARFEAVDVFDPWSGEAGRPAT